MTSDPFRWPLFLPAAVGLVRSPRTLFRTLEKTGSAVGPIVFVLFWQALAVAATVLLSFLQPRLLPFGLVGKAGWLIVGPGVGVAGWLVASAVVFFVWHLLGSPHRYITTLRVTALMAPLSFVRAVLGVVPFLHLIVLAYGLYLIVLASEEVHGIRPRTAWTVWGTLTGVLFLAALALQVIAAIRGGFLAGPPVAVSTLPSPDPLSPESQKRLAEELKKHQENAAVLQRETAKEDKKRRE